MDEQTRRLLTDDPRRGMKKLPNGTPPLEQALLKSVIDANECWIFQGGLVKGYGYVHSRIFEPGYAHHITFDALIRASRDGLWTDHLCRVPACCNPDHIELVTPGENTRRGYWAHGFPRLTHCRAGHTYAEVGIYQPPNGRRRCRVCQNEIIAKQSAKRRAIRKARREHLG